MQMQFGFGQAADEVADVIHSAILRGYAPPLPPGVFGANCLISMASGEGSTVSIML
jgi:hypothetical protein